MQRQNLSVPLAAAEVLSAPFDVGREDGEEGPGDEASMSSSFGQDPAFEHPLDFSDSDVEMASEEQSQPVHHAEARPQATAPIILQVPPTGRDGPASQAGHTSDQAASSSSPATLAGPSQFSIPAEMRQFAETINACPANKRLYRLPKRTWLKKQGLGDVAMRHGTLKRSSTLMEYVGDTRLFSHRMWAYLLFAGKAVPRGGDSYEKLYREAYGITGDDEDDEESGDGSDGGDGDGEESEGGSEYEVSGE